VTLKPSHSLPELLTVVGPTASGKTALAIALASALNGEVVNADSVQVYRYFDIGSGKPSPEELARVPHHLMSVLEPLEDIDAAGWAERAQAVILDIEARGKRPIICGGSFLWVRALLFGLAAAPSADGAIRATHKTIAENEGREKLHQLLAQIDPVCAARLAPNDFVRVSRALEVHQLTGIPMSQWQAEHGFRQPKRPYRLIGIQREREALNERIHLRVNQMLQQGFVEEVRHLCDLGYGQARAMASVGYREVKNALDQGPIDETQLLDQIAQKTRVFARRQRTWLRDEPVLWLSPEEACDRARLSRI
jgi:tRNA dimethylallyltransferase